MYTFLIFIALCAIEFIIVKMKWDDIQDYRAIGKGVASVTGIDKNKKYSTFVKMAGKFLGFFKVFIIIPIIIMTIFNIIASLILGGLLNLIITLFF